MLDERHTTPIYNVYLLRIWQEDAGKCRAILQETQSGERHGFADVDQLLDHIRKLATTDRSE